MKKDIISDSSMMEAPQTYMSNVTLFNFSQQHPIRIRKKTVNKSPPPPASPINLEICNVVKLTPEEMLALRSQKPNRNQTDHIKRPLNAFMAYSKLRRRKIMDDHPEMHHATVSKLLGASWKAFSPEQKKPFYDEAKKLAKEHLLKYPGYKYKPGPKKAKSEKRNLLRLDAILKQFPVSKITSAIHNEMKALPPTGRISPSQFHAWSLIYESEEEEEDAQEEEEID